MHDSHSAITATPNRKINKPSRKPQKLQEEYDEDYIDNDRVLELWGMGHLYMVLYDLSN